jgi:pimeloyl-ACP methyl ester carboxylesterase
LALRSQGAGRVARALRPSLVALWLACGTIHAHPPPERLPVPVQAQMQTQSPAQAQAQAPALTRPQFGVFAGPEGQELDLEWHLPAGPARALVTLQHGFARRCAHLRGLAAVFADSGYATLCVQADMARGAPDLAAALAQTLAAALLQPPDGRALPARVVVAGHSTGGLFAARLGAALAERAPGMLAAVLLFDPVGGAELGDALRRARGAAAVVPALALLAPPSRCNAGQRARPALEAAAVTRVDVEQGTHLDAEGGDTDAVAVWACREGAPREAAVRQLRARALDFADAAVSGPRP